VFRFSGGKFELDAANTKRLAGVGLVSGAVFSDLNGDGAPDLILACEWGPLKIFRNDHGQLTLWDASLKTDSGSSTISRLTGWWNGVATGDFDGDGRMDIVASNWGRNTRYQSHRPRPLQVIYGDLNQDGTEDLVESYYDAAMQKWVPERTLDVLARSLPFLREKFPTREAFGKASVEEIFVDRLKQSQRAEVALLESTVFLNRGDHLEARLLPMEAQLSPAFGLCVGDFDGDGREDLFLAQNFFDAHPETPRCDAGRGLWLRGDGQGGFTPLSSQESGVKIFGEQRGCALADYDGDGRVDLAVTQNGAETKLYQNLRGKPGVRVRLAGPPGNPNGVGATIRLGRGGKFGAAREIHAGSGYWSQDGAVQVVNPAEAEQIFVRWPGGKESRSPIAAGAKEIVVEPSGKIELSR
jgi:hypothetical protein